MKNDIKLVILHNTKLIIEIFAHIFLSIYFFNLTNDISKVILFWLIHSSSNLVYRFIISKITNSKNVIFLYRLGIFLNFIVVATLLYMKEDIANYIYLFALLYNLAISLYWSSYEVIVCNINEKDNYKRFFVFSKVAQNLVYILTPLCLGFVIEKASFTISFLIILIIAAISFFMSLFLNDIDIEVDKLNLKEYFKNIKNKKFYNKILIQNIFDGFLTDGAAEILAVIIVYSQVVSTMISGGISGVTGFIGIIVSLIYMKFINRRNFGKIVIPITFVILILTIVVSFNAGLAFAILYIVINEIGIGITDIAGTSLTYESLSEITDKKYNNDYLWSIQLSYDVGRIIAYGIIFLICRFLPELTGIAFIIFGLSFVLRAVIINNLFKYTKTISS